MWTDEQDRFLRENYSEKSYADIADCLGKSEGAIRNRCYQKGLKKRNAEWTHDELQQLRHAYEGASCNQQLSLVDLAKRFGRLKSNISRKARELGLTNNKRPVVEQRKIRKPKYANDAERKAAFAQKAKTRFAEFGHPRGTLGLRHTQETKDKIAAKSREHAAAMTPERQAQINMKIMRTKVANGTSVPNRPRGSWNAGWHEIGGQRKYYRSGWEANYARYLQWLKDKGQIADWRHEPQTFWFDGVKRGAVSYLPDFWVLENDGRDAFHEVKGWMDDRSKTKIKRMAKYYPDVVLVVIDSKAYREIRRKVSSLVPGWVDAPRDRRCA